jgi:hypothetical protein
MRRIAHDLYQDDDRGQRQANDLQEVGYARKAAPSVLAGLDLFPLRDDASSHVGEVEHERKYHSSEADALGRLGVEELVVLRQRYEKHEDGEDG